MYTERLDTMYTARFFFIISLIVLYTPYVHYTNEKKGKIILIFIIPEKVNYKVAGGEISQKISNQISIYNELK